MLTINRAMVRTIRVTLSQQRDGELNPRAHNAYFRGTPYPHYYPACPLREPRWHRSPHNGVGESLVRKPKWCAFYETRMPMGLEIHLALYVLR